MNTPPPFVLSLSKHRLCSLRRRREEERVLQLADTIGRSEQAPASSARIGWRCVLLSAGLLLAACNNFVLVRAGQPVAVAKSALTVTPGVPWNRLDSRAVGKRAELWTLDGPSLNELTFYGGIADGQPLFRDADRRDAPLPRFKADMLPTDIAALIESSYRVAARTPLFHGGAIEPATLGGRPGFRFRYDFELPDEEVRREGEAVGAVVDGRLYLLTWEAPAILYFDRNLPDFRALAASARFGS